MQEEASNCKMCKFSISGNGYDNYDCRRQAPSMVRVEAWQDIREFVPKFPVMHGDDWCGAFEPKPAPKLVEPLAIHKWIGEGPEPPMWIASDNSICYRSEKDMIECQQRVREKLYAKHQDDAAPPQEQQ